MTRQAVFLVLALLGGVALVAQQRPSGPAADVLLKAAIQREQVDGDLPGAIAQYQAIVARHADNHAVAAKALLQMGGCYETLGKAAEARRAYERISRDYKDIAAMLSAARVRLATLGSPAAQAVTSDPFPARSFDNQVSDGNVVPSSSGKLVAYTRRRPGSPTNGLSLIAGGVVCVRDLVSGRETALYDVTDDHAAVMVQWWQSNDRELVVEVLQMDGDLLSETGKLRVVTISNRRVRDLESVSANERFRSWSPDRLWRASQVPGPPCCSPNFLQKEMREIRLVSTKTGRPRTIGATDSNPEFVWSPDGTRLAFHATDTARGIDEIHVVTLATEDKRVLQIPRSVAPNAVTYLWNGTDPSRALWTSRDEIFFRQNIPQVGNDHFLIPAGGGTARRVCEGRAGVEGNPCGMYSPDGSSMVWQEAATRRLMLRDVRTLDDRPLTRSSGNEKAVWWSPDSRVVAFISNRDGKWGIYVAPIDQAPVNDPIRLAGLEAEPRSGTTDWTGWWPHDGGLMLRLVFPESNVYRLNMDIATGRATAPIERLTQEVPWNAWAAPSPDGRTIAYWHERGSNTGGIATMDAISGARESTLLEHGLGAGPLSWRSAEELVFYEFRPKAGEVRGFRAINIRTKGVTTLDHSEFPNIYNWEYHPRLDEIVVCACDLEEPFGFKVRSLDGKERVIATMEDLPGEFRVSPDGQHIAYSVAKIGAQRTDPNFEMALITAMMTGIAGEMRLMTIDGIDEKVLLRVDKFAWSPDGEIPGPLAWSPDGRLLIYADEHGKHRVMNVATTDSWPLLTPGIADPSVSLTQMRWSPDGTFIVLTVPTNRTAWRRWEGVTYDAVTKAMKARGR